MQMQYGVIAGVEKLVSRLVLGTMIIGDGDPTPSGSEYPNLGLAGSFDLLDAVLANGGNTFDSAHVYNGGSSERALGKWMTARGNREQVVVVTKGGVRKGPPRVTPEAIQEDLFDSYERLETDYIDVYILHRDEPATPAGVFVEALNAHHAAGRIRAFGGSNWTYQRLAEANAYAQERGLVPFTASQPYFGLADQVDDPWGPGCVSVAGPSNRDARVWYAAQQMPLLSYSSLARGFFSGRLTRDNYEEMKPILGSACVKAYCCEENFRRLERAACLAREKNATVPQIALSFSLSSPLNVFPLVGAASEAEFQENIKALDLKLTALERAWLDLELETM
jgi:aryl-alcohol dehydrogenase-like predicted oxidoreductase